MLLKKLKNYVNDFVLELKDTMHVNIYNLFLG